MSVSAVKGFFWAAIAIAVAMFMAAASSAFDRDKSLALFVGGCVLVVVTVLWYRRAIRDAEAREVERLAQQLVELKRQISLTGEPVAVKASSGILLLVLLICGALVSGEIAFTSPGLGSISLFVVVALLTVVMASVVLPRVGKPALTIRRDGLATPSCGFLRWEEIESIGLQSYTTKGVTTHSLDLYVPQLSERDGPMHPLLRAIQRALVRGSRRNFVVIHLASPSITATVVHTLCYDLWKEHTGRTRSWTSFLSEDHIEQLRRGDEQLEMLKRVGEETDPAEMMKRLDEIKKRFGDPPAEQKSKKRLSAEAIARRDALLADLRTVDARDAAARKRVLDKHVKAYSRATMARIAFLVLALAVLAAAGLVLFGE